MKGIVIWYNIKLGYGFIKSEEGKNVFIHKSEIPFWTIYLSKGDKIEFKKKNTIKGIKAIDVKLLNV